MKKFESIYDSEKFGKKELSKIKGGLKATNTNRATNTPRRICIGGGVVGGSIMSNLDSDEDEA